MYENIPAAEKIQSSSRGTGTYLPKYLYNMYIHHIKCHYSLALFAHHVMVWEASPAVGQDDQNYHSLRGFVNYLLMLEQNLWKQLLAVTLLFGWSWTSLSEGQAAPEVVNVTKTIEFRQNLLRSIANFVPISISPQFSTSSSRPDSKLSCSELRYVFISEFPFGRSGNNLIEFTHGKANNPY